MVPHVKAELESAPRKTTLACFEGLPADVKARIVGHVALQDAAYGQRTDPGAEERFWASEERDLPAVEFVLHDAEGGRDHPLAHPEESESEEEENAGGLDAGDSEDSEDEGMNVDEDESENEDGEDGDGASEDGSVGVHGVMLAQVVPEKKTSWKGRGISAMFLVCKELSDLAAVHLFKVVYSRRFINASYYTASFRRHSVHCKTLNLRGRGEASRSIRGFLIVFSLLHSFPNLTALVFDHSFPDFLHNQPSASLAEFTGQVEWLKTKLTELAPRITHITACNVLGNFPEALFLNFPRIESIEFTDTAKFVSPALSTTVIDIAKIVQSISPGAATLTRLVFSSEIIYHVLPINNRLAADSVKHLTHFGWNTRSLSKEIVRFIKLIGPSIQTVSVKEAGWPAETISDDELEAELPSLRSLTLQGDGATLSSSLFLFKNATLTDFALSSTTGICYLLSSGFLLSSMRKQAPTLRTIRFDAKDHYSIHKEMQPIYSLVERHGITLSTSDADYFKHWPTTANSQPHDNDAAPLTPAEKARRSNIMHRKLDAHLKSRKLELERLVREKDLVGLKAFAGLIGKNLKDRLLALKD